LVERRSRIMDYRRLLTAALMVLVLASTGYVSASLPVATQAAVPEQVIGQATDAGAAVVASGEVVPILEAGLSSTVGGRVDMIMVTEGQQVEAGEVLVRLDTTLLEAQIIQAEIAVEAARSQVRLLEAGPQPGQVAGAEAQLAAAEAAVAQAVAQQDQVGGGSMQAEIAAAQAQLAAAEVVEKAALIAYDQMGERDLKDWQKEEIILRLRAAERGRVAAEARIALLKRSASFQMEAAEAAVRTAEAQRDVAQAQLALAQAGPRVEEIDAAETTVAQAEVAADAARLLLDQATLRAPISGEVVALEISPGETVMPGQVLVRLADLEHLRVRTTDLSERDVTKVAIRALATVYVEALDTEVAGRVLEISAQATAIGGDVVFPVVVELDEQPEGLRWGMSVEVEIKAD
jgi:multidrug efflux pump subunit AcrA (membrane-fusion protein)